MAVTGRLVVLAVLGLVPIALWPTLSTVRWWALVLAALVALDVALASSPGSLRMVRGPSGPVRLGEGTQTTLWVTNTARRGVRGLLRDKKLDEAYLLWAQDQRSRAYVELRELAP